MNKKILNKIKINSKQKNVVFNILKSYIKYGCTLKEYSDYEFYLLNDNQKKTYITNKQNKIIINENDKAYLYLIDNKIKFYKLFKDLLNRNILFPNYTNEEFLNFKSKNSNIIAKSLDLKYTINDEIKIQSNNYFIEEKIKQNNKINELYKNEFCKLEITTYYNDKVNILQTIFIIGETNPLYAFLNDIGVIIAPAKDSENNYYGIHPESKKQILGFKIPYFEETIKAAVYAANKIKELKYITWTFIISENGPCLINASSSPKIYQLSPRYTKNKLGNLNKYKEITKLNL